MKLIPPSMAVSTALKLSLSFVSRNTQLLKMDMIDRKKAELDTRRPLTEGEVARLTEEFIVEYT